METLKVLSWLPNVYGGVQAGAVLAGLVLTEAPNVSKAVAAIEPLTSLFGGLYLGSLGMILSPVSSMWLDVMFDEGPFYCGLCWGSLPLSS